MLFENNNNYLDMFLSMPNTNGSAKTVGTEEGFLRGNMFADEYVPYKNLTYIKPKLKGQEEKDLFKIMELCFAINDYNLYLDLNPKDTEILNKYKEATEKLRMLTKAYEEKYGPLSINASAYNTFKWIDAPWPWEREDGKYV